MYPLSIYNKLPMKKIIKSALENGMLEKRIKNRVVKIVGGISK